MIHECLLQMFNKVLDKPLKSEILLRKLITLHRVDI
jgi:hypothetical protein